ncbi:MAG: DUF3592 domain-containing protein [Acidobacteriota bacterium]
MHRAKLILALILLGYGSYVLYEALAFELVPVQAVVIESRESWTRVHNERPDRVSFYFAYTYTVDGQSYTSKRYAIARRDKGEGVCLYNVGDTITAYIRADDPSWAVVKPDRPRFAYPFIGLGLLILIEVIIGLLAERPHSQEWLEKTHRRLGAVIGMTIFVGGLAWVAYTLFIVATRECV